jgi:hypothetical protein
MRYNRYVTNLLVCTISNRIAFLILGFIKFKMRRRYLNTILFVFILIPFSNTVLSNTYYVATPANGGNNNNAGTFSSPFATWGKLSTVLTAGDIGYIRGGTYRSTSGSGDKVLFDNLHGTLTDTIKILAYPGETPILNLDNITTGTSHSAMVRVNNCDYIHIKGLRVTGAVQSAIGNVLWGILLVDVNNSVIENCVADHIGGYGLCIGAAEYGVGGSNNLILNCDAFACEDPYSSVPFGGSNGFTISRYDNTSTNITLRGCRAWYNSDDGFDLFGLNGFITFKNCWSFRNGYHENTETKTGDGMGFKLGPTSSNLATSHLRTVTNCVSVHNYSYGFDQNTDSYTSLMWLYNNFSYNNTSNGFYFGYGISAADIFRNNIEYGSTYGNTFDANDIHDHNDWDASPSVTISDSDFVSLDETQLDDARQVDGSLPNITFGHLVVGSDLIDAGVNIGISYNGTAPDLGAFEYSNTSNNNQPPSIQNQGFLINENSPDGTMVGMVLASDPDAGQTLSYSILSGNTSGAFSINTSTGVLTVSNSATLNFEITPTFALVVKVQDNGTGNLNSQAIVTVSLTDVNEVPVINNQFFSIAENSASGTIIGTVVATNPDAGQTLTYSILSGNTSGAFSINISTGVLSVSNSAALNFEITPTFALVVKVQDNGTGNLSSQATVNISLTDVNEVPVINNQSFSIAENSANGTIVGTVIATNPDAGQTLTYSILSGNTSEAFAIITSTGVLTVAYSAALNFETTPTFALVVKVEDNGTENLSSQATVNISLTDVNEVPVINNQSFSIAENSDNGTIVGTVIATNPDAGQTLTYSILSGNTSEAFAINTSTGVLTVAYSAALNFETTPTFELVVKVEDNGAENLSSQATANISLTDVNEVPVINNQSFSIAENSANGTIVGTVIATNPDAGQTLTYSILSGNTSEAFAIRASTGVLTVANSAAINFETTPTFALLVKVQDNGTGNLSSQAIMQININDSTAFVNIDTITLSNNYETGTNYLLDFYPNPTTGFININCEKVDVDLLNLQLYTISGLIVYQKTYSWAKTISLNIESNQKTTYILVVRSKGKIYTGKIIVK